MSLLFLTAIGSFMFGGSLGCLVAVALRGFARQSGEYDRWLSENVMSADGAPAALLTIAEYDIRQERARQDAKWGGPAHDDQHSLSDFLLFIADQCEKITRESAAEHRSRSVKIAALAVAALESDDRKAGPVADRPSYDNVALRIHGGVTT